MRVCVWLVIQVWPWLNFFALLILTLRSSLFSGNLSVHPFKYSFSNWIKEFKHDPQGTETHSPGRYHCTFLKKMRLTPHTLRGFRQTLRCAPVCIGLKDGNSNILLCSFYQTWFKILILFLSSLWVYRTIYVYVHFQVCVPIVAPADHHGGLFAGSKYTTCGYCK